MLTSKQRAELRARANQLPVLLTVGKGGVSGSLIAEADTVLTAKELVKGQVLERPAHRPGGLRRHLRGHWCGRRTDGGVEICHLPFFSEMRGRAKGYGRQTQAG